MTQLLDLPDELKLMIVKTIDDTAGILNIRQTCRKFGEIGMEALATTCPLCVTAVDSSLDRFIQVHNRYSSANS